MPAMSKGNAPQLCPGRQRQRGALEHDLKVAAGLTLESAQQLRTLLGSDVDWRDKHIESAGAQRAFMSTAGAQ